MKKLVAIITLAAVGLVITFAAAAQTVTYNWKKYGVSFAIPKSHGIKDNTADHFESGDTQTWLELTPYKDANATAKGIVDWVIDNSPAGYKLGNDEGEYKTNGLHGYYAECSARKYPDWQFWIIGLIDPNSDNNYYAVIWWKKGNDKAYSIAQDISASFKPLN